MPAPTSARARWRTTVAVAAAAVLLIPALGSTVARAAHGSAAEPNDPLFPVPQWGPKQVRAEQAWHVTRGEGAVIAVVDSGVDLSHEDLAANAVPGNTFVGCGDAGCGNGDWTTGTDEPNSHGTHVAGIAAAVTDNGVGIAGVAPAAKILAVKVSTSGFLPCLEDAFEDVARGIRWAADNGAHVINLSLGHPVPVVSQACQELFTHVHEAIEYANAKDVVTVAASGNEGFVICSGPPGSAAGAVCVTSTDRREARAAYSNEPVKEDLIAVSAPGGSLFPICREDVLSTVPAGTANAANTSTCGYPANRAYEEFAGTSMAAPHVAGVAALVRSMGCDRPTTIDILTSTARQPLTNPPVRGVFTPAYGYGIVDAEAAAAAAAQRCVLPPPNAAPITANDAAATNEDVAVTIDVLANDSDPDGDALSIAAVAPGTRGTVVNNGDGTVTYTPSPNANGTDTFTYRASDGRAQTVGVVSVTIVPQPDAPVAAADHAFFQASTPVIIDVLANDSDPDGDALSLVSVTQPKNGSATITGSSVTYSPALGFGGSDAFTYRIADGTGRTAIGKVTVFGPECTTKTILDTIEGDPLLDEDNPFTRGWTTEIAVADLPTTRWFPHKDPQARTPVQSWFTDAATYDEKDDRLIAPAFDVTPATQLRFWHRFITEPGFDGGVLEVSTDGGQIWRDVVAAGGTFAQNGYNGTISPGAGSRIAGRPAWTGSAATMREVRVNLGALAGKTVRVRWRLVLDPLALATPGGGWWVDDFQVTSLITDSCVVASTNLAPVVENDLAFTNQGDAVVIDVLANDVDPEGDPLVVLGFTDPGHGTVVSNEDGTLRYTPHAPFRGIDSFGYTVSDGRGGIATGVVTVDVNGRPVASDDSVLTKEQVATTLQVLANDSDPENDTLIVAAFTQPAGGTLSCAADGSCTYTSRAGFSGDEVMTYEACDARAACSTATIRIRVTPAAGEVSCLPRARGFWRNQYDPMMRKFTAAEMSRLTDHASYLSRGYFPTTDAVRAAVLNAYDTPLRKAENQYAVLLLNLAAGDWAGTMSFRVGTTGAERLSSDSYDTATVGGTIDAAATWVRSQLPSGDLTKAISTADAISNGLGLIC